MNNTCYNCRFGYQTYHCRNCSDYVGDPKDCGTFCYYCNHNRGDDSCNNCVYSK